MENRDIIVIGASAGGFEAIKHLVSALPPSMDASIFIVWHMAPHLRGILPDVLKKFETIPAAHALDMEPIVRNRIYVAPPDRHLLIEDGKVRVTRGPKENRFRPAVDPLFRSAAYVYGPRVTGVILSGALDDGTAGLWAIKQHGGLAVVQDPADAEVSSMPEHAIREVKVDYCVPLADMANLLVKLSAEPLPDKKQGNMEDQERTKREVRIALGENALEQQLMKFGKLTPFTCPECQGVLTALQEGGRIRYRCHTGHAFSADSLLSSLTESIEESLWSAIRGVDESIMLLNHLGDHFAEINQPKLAAMYFKKAKEAENRIQLMRKTVMDHELLSEESIIKQAAEQDEYSN